MPRSATTLITATQATALAQAIRGELWRHPNGWTYHNSSGVCTAAARRLLQLGYIAAGCDAWRPGVSPQPGRVMVITPAGRRALDQTPGWEDIVKAAVKAADSDRGQQYPTGQCEYCQSTGDDVEHTIDPYESDVNSRRVLINTCAKCLQDRSDNI